MSLDSHRLIPAGNAPSETAFSEVLRRKKTPKARLANFAEFGGF
jgi:hypothetical protein